MGSPLLAIGSKYPALHYIYYYPNPKYSNIGYMDPSGNPFAALPRFLPYLSLFGLVKLKRGVGG